MTSEVRLDGWRLTPRMAGEVTPTSGSTIAATTHANRRNRPPSKGPPNASILLRLAFNAANENPPKIALVPKAAAKIVLE